MYRRNSNALAIPSPTETELANDDLDGFLKDPAKFRDILPQPFRFIDKILSRVLDDAWDIISAREAEKLAEASRIHPPQYQATLQLEACPLEMFFFFTYLTRSPQCRYDTLKQTTKLNKTH